MTVNRINRTIRVSVLSTFLALAAFLFLAFGSASAHTLTHAASAAQTAGSGTTTVVRLIRDHGDTGSFVFSPSTITVKAGSSVKIVNKTTYYRIIFTPNVVGLASGASVTLTVTQSEAVGICGGGALTINVV